MTSIYLSHLFASAFDRPYFFINLVGLRLLFVLSITIIIILMIIIANYHELFLS